MGAPINEAIPPIKMGDGEAPVVEEFKYLGSIITPNYGGFKKRTEFNFLVYTESNSTRRIKLRVR
jgi:hypothetical protein